MYPKHSIFSKATKDGGNAKFLITAPIKIYADLDIDVLDQTEILNKLRISGNENAKFINILGKGYRLNGIRHPYSWSIAERNECMFWIIDKIR